MLSLSRAASRTPTRTRPSGSRASSSPSSTTSSSRSTTSSRSRTRSTRTTGRRGATSPRTPRSRCVSFPCLALFSSELERRADLLNLRLLLLSSFVYSCVDCRRRPDRHQPGAHPDVRPLRRRRHRRRHPLLSLEPDSPSPSLPPPSLVRSAIEKKACNGLLLKVNQIGTITESIKATQLASSDGWCVPLSSLLLHFAERALTKSEMGGDEGAPWSRVTFPVYSISWRHALT